jgi:hypothetical protein
MQGDVRVTIRDLTQVGACAGNARVAEGRAEMNGIDNAIFGADDDSHTYVWTNKFQGQLMTPSGEKVACSAGGQHSYSVKKGFRAFHEIHLHCTSGLVAGGRSDSAGGASGSVRALRFRDAGTRAGGRLPGPREQQIPMSALSSRQLPIASTTPSAYTELGSPFDLPRRTPLRRDTT